MFSRLFSKIMTFVKRRKLLTVSIVVVVLVAIYFLTRGSGDPERDFVVVKYGDLVQEVSVTGKVKPAQNVDLAFEKSGRVTNVSAKVGDEVYPGQTLVSLFAADLAADLARAQANASVERAKLEELQRGTRPEEIQISEIKAANAKTALADTVNTLSNSLIDAYTKSDDAVRSKTDQLFYNPRTSNAQLIFATDYQLQLDVQTSRTDIEKTLNDWGATIYTAKQESDFPVAISNAKKSLNQIRVFLDKIAFILSKLSANSSITQTTIDGWKADNTTARTNINTALTNLNASEEKWRAAQSALTLAEQQLALDKAGATQGELESQKSLLASAEASVRGIQAQIAKTVITAPIGGVVTKQDAKVGEIANPSVAIVSIISSSQYEIEANIPEADIAKIALGNVARVTLDAYGNDVVFETRVVKIDPAETVVEGVSTYKVTLQFVGKDNRVKSGMTANIDISTERREHVFAVPQRAVVAKEGSKYVRILNDDGTLREVQVETGVRGSDGTIEIIKGVSEGDKVVTFVGTQ